MPSSIHNFFPPDIPSIFIFLPVFKLSYFLHFVLLYGQPIYNTRIMSELTLHHINTISLILDLSYPINTSTLILVFDMKYCISRPFTN